MTIFKKSVLAAAALAMPSLAFAAPTIYFGENLTPGAAVSGAPLTARNLFAAQLTGVSTETFEGLAAGTPPAVLTFTGSAGPIAASLSANGGQICVTNGCGGSGRFATSPVTYFDVSDRDFTITFSTAIAAFGFYGTDIGDFNGQLTIELIRTGGTNTMLTVANTIGAPDGSLLFWGAIDTANPFNAIKFGNTNAGTDFFGFDDVIVGDKKQVTGGVPEASTWAMMIAGFGIVGFAMRARTRKVSYSALA